MSLYHSTIKKNYYWKNITRAALFLTGFIGIFAFIGYQAFVFLHRSQTDIYFSRNESFSILVYGFGESRKDLNHVSFVLINPQTKRIGVISFYPQTRFSNQETSLQEKMFNNEKGSVKKEISRLLNISPKYQIEYDMKSTVKALDIAEGVPFFLSGVDLIKDEKIPTGEFIMDGEIVQQYLTNDGNNEFSPALTLFRYYSLALNFWQNKESKWKILSDEGVFSMLTEGIKTDLSQKELYSLAKHLFTDNSWSPIFIEIPLKREKDIFIIDVDSTALYLKKLMEDLNSPSNPFLDREPRIEIKNGTMVPNLARKVRSLADRKGLKVLEFSNADEHDYQNSILVDVNANYYYVQSVSRLLNIPRVYYSVNRSYFTDMIIVIGNDYKELELN